MHYATGVLLFSFVEYYMFILRIIYLYCEYNNKLILKLFQVNYLKEFIPKAFPLGDSLIIDGEILLVNTKTNEILPFGEFSKFLIKKMKNKHKNI